MWSKNAICISYTRFRSQDHCFARQNFTIPAQESPVFAQNSDAAIPASQLACFRTKVAPKSLLKKSPRQGT